MLHAQLQVLNRSIARMAATLDGCGMVHLEFSSPPRSQDSRLCRDITVLKAFRILQKSQCWVRQSKQGEKNKYTGREQQQKQIEGYE